MDKIISQKMQNLIEYLNSATRAYLIGEPVISDKEWDNKYFELKALEEETGLIYPNSPTQSIHYETVSALNKIEHSHKMLSLDKTKSVKEALQFIKNKNVLIMYKMDGLTCSLTYRNGELVSAETRGNGLIGEDITHNAKILSSIPKQIPYKDELVIDGEIICKYSNFAYYQNDYKNPRNFAAGAIRLLSAEECSKRRLTFVGWDIITQLYFDNEIEYRVSQKLDLLSSFGFETVPYTIHNGTTLTEDNLAKILFGLQKESKIKDYPIDGAVIKFDDCEYGRSLGETSHHFNNALSFKFYDEVYLTSLLDIEWTMGRQGILTPVAVFEAVDIDGCEVERASLHNIDIMFKQLQHETVNEVTMPIRNQFVEVYKANAIIPQIANSYVDENSETVSYIKIPEICPICGGQLEVRTEANTRVLYCTNPNCEGKLINQLEHFCGKKGLDIKGISKATLEKLVDWGWVSDKKDIFELKQYRSEWIKLPGFGPKSVDKILDAIELSRKCEVNQFICALGIPLIGTTASKELVKHFETWDNFIDAVENKYKFYQLPNFGFEMNDAIIKYDYTMAKELVTNYIVFNTKEISQNTTQESSENLKGITFVVTGKTVIFKNRDSLKEKIEGLGGKVTGSVSKNTNYLINNDVNSTTSKNATAKSLGVPILSEEEFIQMFGIVI